MKQFKRNKEKLRFDVRQEEEAMLCFPSPRWFQFLLEHPLPAQMQNRRTILLEQRFRQQEKIQPWTITCSGKITGHEAMQPACCRKPHDNSVPAYSGSAFFCYDSLLQTFLQDLYLPLFLRDLLYFQFYPSLHKNSIIRRRNIPWKVLEAIPEIS